jgi:hypothetical protein
MSGVVSWGIPFMEALKARIVFTQSLEATGGFVPYSQVFCHEKQENFGILYLKVEPSVIPARFWPESRDALGWIPAKGMPE